MQSGDGLAHRHHRIHRYIQFSHPGGFEDLDFNGPLGRFDHRDDIAFFDLIAGFDLPLDQCGFVHVRAERRHQEVAHTAPFINLRAMATMRSTWGRAACSMWCA